MTEATLRNPNNDNEGVRKQPFLIRSHHLSKYAQLVDRLGSGPMDLNDTRQSILEDHVNHEFAYTFNSSDRDYVADLFGENLDYNQFKSRIMAVYSRFLTLPDDHQVVVLNTPDHICEACAIGSHCIIGDLDFFDRSRMRDFLSELTRLVRHNGYKLPFEIQPSIQISDATRINTSLGVIRNFLKHRESIPGGRY